MTSHSNILGGSNAARLLACPASYQEQLRAPVADVESVYAAEGSMLHDVIAGILKPSLRVAAPPALTDEQAETIAKSLIMLEQLKAEYGGGFRIIAVEQTLPFPGVGGSFGTVDLVLASKTHVLLPDWKFGSGVPVKVVYDMGDYDVLNAQPAFYAICARAKRRKMFAERQVVLAIIQPRLDSVSHVVTDNEELDQFEAALTAAYNEAIGRQPHMEKGEHCRFATCKATCPLWTGPVFNLADIDPARAALEASVTSSLNTAAYGDFLSQSLAMAEIAETWAEEIRRQAHVFLEDGGVVPHWKLTPKRANRSWIDEARTFDTLRAMGVSETDLLADPKIRSVAQMEKQLKLRSVEVPKDLYHAVSNGTTIVHGDDPRPESTHATVAVELRKALSAL